jgi:hypothetical protein
VEVQSLPILLKSGMLGFYLEAWQKCNNRSFFTTLAGYVGTGPLQQSDVVALIPGWGKIRDIAYRYFAAKFSRNFRGVQPINLASECLKFRQ